MNIHLRANGTVAIDGQTLSNVVSIAAGNHFSLGLKRDGTVIAWGDTKVPDGLNKVVAISAQVRTSLALKSDGTVFTWWNFKLDAAREHGQPHVVEGLSNAVAIVAGGNEYAMRDLALKSDGTVFTWGTDTIYIMT